MNGGQQFFLGRFFHHVPIRARAEGALCKQDFLKGRIHQDQQSRPFFLEALNKFQAVAGPEPQRSEQQMRFALSDLMARIPHAVGFAAHHQVRLRIEAICDPVAKQRVLFQHEDALFRDLWCGRDFR